MLASNGFPYILFSHSACEVGTVWCVRISICFQAIQAGLDAARSQLNSANTDKDTAEAEINVAAWEALRGAA